MAPSSSSLTSDHASKVDMSCSWYRGISLNPSVARDLSISCWLPFAVWLKVFEVILNSLFGLLRKCCPRRNSLPEYSRAVSIKLIPTSLAVLIVSWLSLDVGVSIAPNPNSVTKRLVRPKRLFLIDFIYGS